MADRFKPLVTEPSPGRLWVLLAYSDPDQSLQVRADLEKNIARIDFETDAGPGDAYRSPYGYPSHKLVRFISFKQLIGREELVDIRKKTLQIEKRHAAEGRPAVEIDPGYVVDYSVVRTSLLEDFHRIYLYHGIFAESLYFFERMTYRPWQTTPEFYRQKEVISVFNDLRAIYKS